MLFPAERVAFATEFLADALVANDIHSAAERVWPVDGKPLAEWIKSYRTVEGLDFDVLATGHGAPLFTKGRRETTATTSRSRVRSVGRHEAGKSLTS